MNVCTFKSTDVKLEFFNGKTCCSEIFGCFAVNSGENYGIFIRKEL